MNRYNKILIASDGESALLMLNGAIIPSENFSFAINIPNRSTTPTKYTIEINDIMIDEPAYLGERTIEAAKNYLEDILGSKL